LGALNNPAVNGHNVIAPEFMELVGGVVEPDEGDDRHDRYDEHENLLIFADHGEHRKRDRFEGVF
jgi:hypothetical protein